MAKQRKFLLFFLTVLTLAALLAVPALALTDTEVEDEVTAVGKEAVAGNVLIWFMCAVAFLKVSQKIDSFMSSLGVNVGHTGGSMLAETMIAARTITAAAGMLGHPIGGGHKAPGGSGGSGSTSGSGNGSGWFLKGGIAGVMSRKINNDAVRTATAQGSAVHTGNSVKASQVSHTASVSESDRSVHTESSVQGGEVHADNSVYAGNPVQTENESQADVSVFARSAIAHDTVIQGEAEHLSNDSACVDGSTQASGTIHTECGPVAEPSPSDDGTDGSSPAGAHTQQGDPIFEPSGETPTVVSYPDSIQEGHSVHHSSTERFTRETATTRKVSAVRQHFGIGGAMFTRSLASGGQFANEVIGKVATGDIRSAGSIQGETAAQAMMSYSGITAMGGPLAEQVRFSDVEIGGGRITGTEATPGNPEGIGFAMYHTDKYAKPDDHFQRVRMADGTVWYKQYAMDSVVKTPYKAPDGEVAYHSSIVKKLPKAPMRKDKL